MMAVTSETSPQAAPPWKRALTIELPSALRAPGARLILKTLGAGGGAALFVGGSVRNALCGEAVGDVDVATPLSPGEVMERMKAAGATVVATGLAHGTVTVVCGGRGYEVTTLRRDVETYGRKARVEFSGDWRDDAGRRDFTFNALYADGEGHVFDPWGGVGDLRAGRVRFVGSADRRVREDYLRILRFFRFLGRYGKAPPDGEALAACRRHAGGLESLSGERVWKEWRPILAADTAPSMLALMESCGVLGYVFPFAAGRVKRVLALFESLRTPHDLVAAACVCGVDPALLRLAALSVACGATPEIFAYLKCRLRLANREAAFVEAASVVPSDVPGVLRRRTLLFRFGREVAAAVVALEAVGGESSLMRHAGRFLAALAGVARPCFPLRGRDLLVLGVEPGAEVGRLLSLVEVWWLRRNCRPLRRACLDEAGRALSMGDARMSHSGGVLRGNRGGRGD